MPPERTIAAGQIWAYRDKPSKPLQRAQIIDPGPHTQADIRARLLDVPGQPVVVGKKLRYPCKREDLEAYVEHQREIADRQEAESRLEALREGERLAQERAEFQGLHVTVPELLAVAMGRVSSPRVAFSVDVAAEECGVSTQFIRSFVVSGELRAHFANFKKIILAEDLHSWIKSLPTERA